MKIKAIELSALIALVFTVAMTLSFESTCSGVREKVLRLHVIANSDSVSDQSLKYAVRDELLRDGESIFSGSETADEAEGRISQNILFLKETAEKVIAKEGYDYTVNIDIGRTYFPTREYGKVTLPAGYYNAVRVIIGEGKGKNWWCVMFPPMCLPAARKDSPDLEDILTDEEISLVTEEGKYELRFWFVEKYYELREKFID